MGRGATPGNTWLESQGGVKSDQRGHRWRIMRQVQAGTEAHFKHLPIGRCEGQATLTLKAWPPQDAVQDAGKNMARIPAHGGSLPDVSASVRSTSAVLPETVPRAGALERNLGWLPAWFDIDTPADMQRLRTTLAQGMEPQQPRQSFESGRHTVHVRRGAYPCQLAL